MKKEVNIDDQPHTSDYWRGFKNALMLLEDLGYCGSSLHGHNIADCTLAKVNLLGRKKPRKTDQKLLNWYFDFNGLYTTEEVTAIINRVKKDACDGIDIKENWTQPTSQNMPSEFIGVNIDYTNYDKIKAQNYLTKSNKKNAKV